MKKINFRSQSNLLEHIVYIFSLIVFYILHTSCDFIPIYRLIPVGVLAVTLYVAMSKDLLTSCFYSLIAGILCDVAINMPIGVSSVVCVLFCGLVSILTIYYIKFNIGSFMFFELMFILMELTAVIAFKYEGNVSVVKIVLLGNVISSIVLAVFVCLFVFLFFSYIMCKLSVSENF